MRNFSLKIAKHIKFWFFTPRILPDPEKEYLSIPVHLLKINS